MTGHIVRSMDEAIRMLPQVLALDRRAVRQRFEQLFSAIEYEGSQARPKQCGTTREAT